MRFLLLGCGSIGRRHLRNLKAISSGFEVDLYDPDTKLLEEISDLFFATPVDETSIDSKKYDCVFVCTPPVSHVNLAIRALLAGSNVFIEKPISSNPKGISKLQLLARNKNLGVFVGYNFRFNRGIILLKKILDGRVYGRLLHISAYFGQYLPEWRPTQDYTKNYSSRKDLGGGIILDGSHEMDYLLWLLGRPISVQSHFKTTDILLSDTEAITDILLEFGQGILGYIHLDFIRRQYRRGVEALCEDGILNWSLMDATIRKYSARKHRWYVTHLNEGLNDMYLSELRHVIECIRNKRTSHIIGLDNGISSFRLSSLAYKSGVSGKRLKL